MKLHLLIFTILLGTIALAPAQGLAPEKPSTKSSRSPVVKEPPKDAKSSADNSVSLPAGSLATAVRAIEQRIPTWPQKPEEGAGDWVLPNILYGQDTADAVVPGVLTLRGVSPLQAVTLAAAAANCTLEPIVATKEESDYQNAPGAIIGYRIVRDAKQSAAAGGPNGFSGMLSASSQAAAAQVDAANAAQGVANKALNSERARGDKAVEGAVADVTVLDPARAMPKDQNTPRRPSLPVSVPGSTDPFGWGVKAPDDNRTFVRIYALGSILSGSKEEIEEKKVHLQDLVTVAMRKTEPDTIATSNGAPGTTTNNRAPESAAEALPELSFHLELRALVVKGTAAQHEIIEQVMKVLKENEKPWWPQPATSPGR